MNFMLYYPKFWSQKSLLSFLLWPLSYLYQVGTFFRNFFAQPIAIAPTVICIGNVTVGGTGKTQLILWIAKKLQERNRDLVIISKGYKSSLRKAQFVYTHHQAEDVGDEALMLSHYGPVIAARSFHDALPLINDLKPSYVLFDDGLQNPHFAKDVSLLVIDPIRGVGNGLIFPAGPLREKVSSGLKKAEMIVLIGSQSLLDPGLRRQLYCSEKPIVEGRIELLEKFDKTKRYFAFTGIGHPERFFSLLESQGLCVERRQVYPDHHHYRKNELLSLADEAQRSQRELITTEKDYVKLKSFQQEVLCAQAELVFSQQAEEKLLNILCAQTEA